MNDAYQTVIDELVDVKIDALSNIEAKRGNRIVNQIIVATIRLIENLYRNEEFYRGEALADMTDFASNQLSDEKELVGLWLEFAASCKSKDLVLRNDDEFHTMLGVTYLLGELVDTIPELSSLSDMIKEGHNVFEAISYVWGDDSKEVRKDIQVHAELFAWDLMEASFRLLSAELRIWHEHPEWDSDERKELEECYAEIQAFNKETVDAFSHLNTAINGLQNRYDSSSAAFMIKGKKGGKSLDFSKSVRVVLAMRRPFSEYLIKWRKVFLDQLRQFFAKQVSTIKNREAKNKWLDAAAELESAIILDYPVYTETQAAKIVELSNAAQSNTGIKTRLILRNMPRKIS